MGVEDPAARRRWRHVRRRGHARPRRGRPDREASGEASRRWSMSGGREAGCNDQCWPGRLPGRLPRRCFRSSIPPTRLNGGRATQVDLIRPDTGPPSNRSGCGSGSRRRVDPVMEVPVGSKKTTRTARFPKIPGPESRPAMVAVDPRDRPETWRHRGIPRAVDLVAITALGLSCATRALPESWQVRDSETSRIQRLETTSAVSAVGLSACSSCNDGLELRCWGRRFSTVARRPGRRRRLGRPLAMIDTCASR